MDARDLNTWDEFQDMMEAKISLLCKKKCTPDNMNLESTAIVTAIHECMRECAPPSATVTTLYPITWWTKEIDKLYRKIKNIRGYIRKWFYKRLNRNLPDTEHNKMKYSFVSM